MNYSLKMARLDYFTCKPNIISYFTLIPVTIIFSFMSTSSIFIFNFTAAWFIALMSTNIFVVQEKNELERLYASLSLTTQNIVAGRYIYTDMYPEFWTHIYKLGGHHGCFSVFYRRHPFCFCLDSFAIIVINIFINSNCKFFK